MKEKVKQQDTSSRVIITLSLLYGGKKRLNELKVRLLFKVIPSSLIRFKLEKKKKKRI